MDDWGLLPRGPHLSGAVAVLDGEGMFDRLAPSLLLLLVSSVGCHKEAPSAPEPEASSSAQEVSSAPEAGEGGHHTAPVPPEAAPEHARGYPVPFAWEASPEEPMARIRGFLGEMMAENHRYSSDHKPDFFNSFRAKQTPRVTVVACSDSRVQTTAFDATPENDAFVIRDIGNQISTAEGSVEYGIRHLHTPLLLILGHTGCGAIKAVLGAGHGVEPAIAKELSTLVVEESSGEGHGRASQAGAEQGGASAHGGGHSGSPAGSSSAASAEKSHGAGREHGAEKAHGSEKGHAAEKEHGQPAVTASADAAAGAHSAPPDERKPSWHADGLGQEERVWLYAVIANVNWQVRRALVKYAKELDEGQVVVVGAVYDFRNDMGFGLGKLVAVNVNGNTDVKRIAAFNRAIGGVELRKAEAKEPVPGAERAGASHAKPLAEADEKAASRPSKEAPPLGIPVKIADRIRALQTPEP